MINRNDLLRRGEPNTVEAVLGHRKTDGRLGGQGGRGWPSIGSAGSSHRRTPVVFSGTPQRTSFGGPISSKENYHPTYQGRMVHPNAYNGPAEFPLVFPSWTRRRLSEDTLGNKESYRTTCAPWPRRILQFECIPYPEKAGGKKIVSRRQFPYKRSYLSKYNFHVNQTVRLPICTPSHQLDHGLKK